MATNTFDPEYVALGIVGPSQDDDASIDSNSGAETDHFRETPAASPWCFKLNAAKSFRESNDHALIVQLASPHGHRFCSVRDPAALYHLIKATPPDKRIFWERPVDRDAPLRVYFDVEFDPTDDDKQGCPMPEKEQVTQFTLDLIIDNIFSKHYGIDLTPSQIHVLDGSREQKKSFHFLLPYQFDRPRRREFARRLRIAIVEAPTGLPDTTVYKDNQPFRMFMCNKAGYENHLKRAVRIGEFEFAPWAGDTGRPISNKV